jgi:hypothetical protein
MILCYVHARKEYARDTLHVLRKYNLYINILSGTLTAYTTQHLVHNHNISRRVDTSQTVASVPSSRPTAHSSHRSY